MRRRTARSSSSAARSSSELLLPRRVPLARRPRRTSVRPGRALPGAYSWRSIMRPYRHIPFIATAIAALVCPLARAEELPASGPLPLGDVVAYARAHNPELEAARQRQAAARAVPSQAAAWDDPTLAAESWNSPRAVPYDDAENNIVKLSQRIPFPGKLGLKGRMAERDADMAAADARMTELTVLESVKQAYWDLWLADRHLAVYTRDLELPPGPAAGAAGRYAVGMGGQPDVLRAEVERTRIATRLVTTRLERERPERRRTGPLPPAPREHGHGQRRT